jgi:predicted dehydrogenase
MTWLSLRVALALLPSLVATMWSTVGPTPLPPKRIAFIVESWYPRSHPDVIGTRFLDGYRLGQVAYPPPLRIASVFTDAPRTDDRSRQLAARYGFKIAESIADALLDDPRSPRPQLIADGVLIATREDLPRLSGQLPSPTPRLQTVREVMRILDLVGASVPIFIDKMLAANWADSQTIVAEAARRSIPLMAGSVLPFTPLDRPVRSGNVAVAVTIASAPYWANAFHAMEFLQGYMEQRSAGESGISAIREVGAGYWSLPDRARWGGDVFDALLASARTRTGRMPFGPGVHGFDATIMLIQYADGTRGVLALMGRAFDESEFLLGVKFATGTIETGGLILRSEPFDHFGYLVHALAQFFTSGRPPVPVARTLLTTGVVLHGRQVQRSDSMATPFLTFPYAVPKRSP